MATNSLVQAIEVWRPDSSGGRLEWTAGAYGDEPLLGDQRGGRTIGPGDGVVGEAFEQGLPTVAPCGAESLDDELRGLDVSHIVAIPTMHHGQCRGIVSLLCGESDRRQGAVEIWRPNERNELAVTSGWYANLEQLGSISRFVKFPRRAGLPGQVWENRFPKVLGSLGTSKDFVRAAGAKADGLSTGVGIPFMRSAREIDAVLLLLSAQRSP
ncbi:MAG: hypothetical protein AAGG46_11645, partial [Planctomycetota bacterium]